MFRRKNKSDSEKAINESNLEEMDNYWEESKKISLSSLHSYCYQIFHKHQ